LVNNLLQLSVLSDEAVVLVTVFGRVNTHEIATPVVLEDGLQYNLLCARWHLQERQDVLLLDPVQFCKLLRLR